MIIRAIKVTHDISLLSFCHLLTLLLVYTKLNNKDFELSWFQATSPSWLIVAVGLITYLIAVGRARREEPPTSLL